MRGRGSSDVSNFSIRVHWYSVQTVENTSNNRRVYLPKYPNSALRPARARALCAYGRIFASRFGQDDVPSKAPRIAEEQRDVIHAPSFPPISNAEVTRGEYRRYIICMARKKLSTCFPPASRCERTTLCRRPGAQRVSFQNAA